jgi:hypothetical protein
MLEEMQRRGLYEEIGTGDWRLRTTSTQGNKRSREQGVGEDWPFHSLTKLPLLTPSRQEAHPVSKIVWDSRAAVREKSSTIVTTVEASQQAPRLMTTCVHSDHLSSRRLCPNCSIWYSWPPSFRFLDDARDWVVLNRSCACNLKLWRPLWI